MFYLSHYPPLSVTQKVLLISDPRNNFEICPLYFSTINLVLILIIS